MPKGFSVIGFHPDLCCGTLGRDDLDARRDIDAATGEQLERCMKVHAGEPIFPGLGRRAHRTVNALVVD